MDAEDESGVPVASPCIGICRVDGDDVCLGCGRMIDEIVEWTRVSDARRREVVALAAERLAHRVMQYPA